MLAFLVSVADSSETWAWKMPSTYRYIDIVLRYR